MRLGLGQALALQRHRARWWLLLSAMAWAGGMYAADVAAATGPADGDVAARVESAGAGYVGIIETYYLKDPERERDVPLKLYYPVDGGPYPLILFSHGVGGTKDYAPDLALYWASHGYVCIHPTHLAYPEPLRKISLTRAVKEFARREEQGPDAWADRIRDLTVVLDSLDRLVADLPELEGKIDPTRVGVGGHSFGGYTAELIGGAVLYPDSLARSYRDDRVKAIVVLSGAGEDNYGLVPQSFATIAVPMLAMGGSRDPGVLGEDPEWRLEPFVYAPPGDKYGAFLEGANHLTYIGYTEPGKDTPFGRVSSLFRRVLLLGALQLYNRGEDQKPLFDEVAAITTAFWDAYLKDDLGARAYLRSDAPARDSGGAAAISWK